MLNVEELRYSAVATIHGNIAPETPVSLAYALVPCRLLQLVAVAA